MKSSFIVCCALFVPLVVHQAAAELELKGSPTELRRHLGSIPGQVHIVGVAEIKVEANQAVLTLKVSTRDRLLKKAMERNRQVRDDIVQMLTQKGLSKDRVRVSRFSSTPAHGLFSKEAKAYDIESTVEVAARHENEVETVSGIVDDKPEVSLDSLRFEHSDEDKLRLQALREALDKIVAQKAVYEVALGAELRPRGMLVAPPGERALRERTGAEPVEDVAGLSSILADPQFRIGVRALASKGADLSQFNQVVYRAQITLTFEVLPKGMAQ
jgi:uncharacterized protein YggE